MIVTNFSYDYPTWLANGGTTTGVTLFTAPDWKLVSVKIIVKGFTLTEKDLGKFNLNALPFYNLNWQFLIPPDGVPLELYNGIGIGNVPPKIVWPDEVVVMDLDNMFYTMNDWALVLLCNPTLFDPSLFLIKGTVVSR